MFYNIVAILGVVILSLQTGQSQNPLKNFKTNETFSTFLLSSLWRGRHFLNTTFVPADQYKRMLSFRILFSGEQHSKFKPITI